MLAIQNQKTPWRKK